MRRLNTQFLLMSCGLMALSGCASVATQLPDVSIGDLASETAVQENLALTELDLQSARLMRVSWPILRDNVELCPDTRYDLGVWTHELGNYDKRLRAASARQLGAKQNPSIFQIAPNSPAAMAGLEPGDEFMNAEGKTILPSDKTLQAALSKGGPVDIEVRRNGIPATVTITPIEVCDYNLQLRPSSDINAYANGNAVTMTTGMMNFVRDDNELALIVGHELAHNTMGHISKIIGNYILSGLSTRYTRQFESEADYVGMYYMVRAGYDSDNVESFWRRLATVNPDSVGHAKTHPTSPDRYLRLAAARAEVERKQAAGEPLVPNYKPGAS